MTSENLKYVAIDRVDSHEAVVPYGFEHLIPR